MNNIAHVLSIILFFCTGLWSAENPHLPYEIYFPYAGLRSWIDTLEVSGEVRAEAHIRIGGYSAELDSLNRFHLPLPVHKGENRVAVSIDWQGQVFPDTLLFYGMELDHLDSDSVFINANIPDSLELVVASPRTGPFRRETTSIRGWTHPRATLTLNGDTLPVFPSGSFTRLIEIPPGQSRWILTAQLDTATLSDTIDLDRPVPMDWNTPHHPRLDPRAAWPSTEFWSMTGEALPLEIRGTPGQEVLARIPGISSWINLPEIAPGVYHRELQVGTRSSHRDVRVRYRIAGKPFQRTLSGGIVRILDQPLGGITSHPDTRVYDIAIDENLLFPLPDSIDVQIIGLENDMYRIRLAGDRSGYVWRSRVTLAPEALHLRPLLLGSLQARNDSSDWHTFQLLTGERRLPYEIREYGDPLRLELRIYGAKQGWEWTIYPEENPDIDLIERTQPDDGVWQMTFYPRGTVFWGWYAHYVGKMMEIGIRKPPEIEAGDPFANIRIVVDPGHGGRQRGAMGHTGYGEADANLRYSRMLVQKLREAGAHAMLTRNIDRQMDLSERARIAREDSCHIFVWAHNNAPASTRDYLEVRGTSTYYTWPSSKQLCDATYPHLGAMGLPRSGEVVRYYYYMTRQTEYLVYLIEGGFMTHPVEEMFLRSEEGLDRLAEAAFQGLREFLLSQAATQ